MLLFQKMGGNDDEANDSIPMMTGASISNYMYDDCCPDCQQPLIIMQNESCSMCPYCTRVYGTCDFLSIPRPSIQNFTITTTDEQHVVPISHTQRINHFNDLLAQIQGKENPRIPNELLTTIMEHAFEDGLREKYDITPKYVYSVLKKLRLRRYYNHRVRIAYLLTGIEPEVMTLDMEDKCRHMFVMVCATFEKHCPASRTNFLSYPYCVYKVCELLGYTQFTANLPLLKGKKNLQKQEEMFRPICAELGWPFYECEI